MKFNIIFCHIFCHIFHLRRFLACIVHSASEFPSIQIVFDKRWEKQQNSLKVNGRAFKISTPMCRWLPRRMQCNAMQMLYDQIILQKLLNVTVVRLQLQLHTSSFSQMILVCCTFNQTKTMQFAFIDWKNVWCLSMCQCSDTSLIEFICLMNWTLFG